MVFCLVLLVQEYMDSNKYIEHLLTQLEEQHRSLWREKLAVARLQREVAQRTSEGAMHEKLIHELEEERHLRLQSEKRLQEVTLESERNRVQMRGLQQQFSRMEETVRNLLQSQGPPEQKKEEPVNIMPYQEKPSEEERKHKETLDDLHMVVDEDSRSESSSTDEGKEKTKLLLERLKALEAENSALALENENQREQYERCLDESLIIREECVKLKTRVFDLEQQNRTLSILFQQRVRPASDLLLQIKETNENLQEDEEDTIVDSTFQSHIIESNCQMRTLDSGIGTFPLPESGNRSMGRYICPPDSPEEPDPLLSLQPAPSAASSIRAQTLEREVPSSAESQCSTKTAIVHSVSDPVMMTRGMRPQSRLPKPASSGIMPITFQVRRFLPAVMHFLTKMENCPPGEEKNQ
uniref:NCK associated protein 5 n=1 Tax=Sciurus vulgaris TaxID=55149 RepID=A0A8D2ALE3_SCIVU